MAPFGLLMIGLAAPAGAAGPMTAEAAMERYRSLVAPIALLNCPKAGSPDEIVVCGRTEGRDPNRLPVPPEPVPGRIVKGEAFSQVEAMGERETCSTVGPNQNCGGGLPVIPIAIFAARVALHAIKGDE
jgi:hypothetical protein